MSFEGLCYYYDSLLYFYIKLDYIIPLRVSYIVVGEYLSILADSIF